MSGTRLHSFGWILCGLLMIGMPRILVAQPQPPARWNIEYQAATVSEPVVGAVNLPPGKVPLPETASPVVRLSLIESLRLAQLSNLDIALAREVVNAALAKQEQSRLIWFPTLPTRSGSTESSSDVSGGVPGFSPVYSMGLGDALFTPRVAERLLEASRAAQTRVTNETLLAVADAYLQVVRGIRRVSRSDETLLYLTSEQSLQAGIKTRGVLPITQEFVKSGEALPGDQARVEVDILRRREETILAVQELRIAMAELARLLRLDPQQLIWPTDDYRWAIPIPGEDWMDVELPGLIEYALLNRPELAESRFLVAAAQTRLQAARWRPWLPNLISTFSGNSNQRVLASDRTNERDGMGTKVGQRTDWDVGLVWRFQNLGTGINPEKQLHQSLHDQASLRGMQMQDRVMTQVVQTVEQIEQSAERVRLLQAGLFDEQGQPNGPVYRSLKLNLQRFRAGQGRVTEVLEAVRGLNDVREAYVSALTEYEQARFRLLVVLGISPESLLDPQRMPAAPIVSQNPAAPLTEDPVSVPALYSEQMPASRDSGWQTVPTPPVIQLPAR